jgi:hypothetical protein
MSETLKQIEALPAAYPDAPGGLSTAAAALDTDVIWQRIEAYTAHRFTTREVVWTVEGEGNWTPPLTPATITASEKWESGAWADLTLVDGPYGYCFASDGPFRVTANVGSGTVPAAINEAFRRLVEYLADETDRAGASDYSVNIGGAVEESYQRNPTWVARAMQYSGAADLLRPYRRV